MPRCYDLASPTGTAIATDKLVPYANMKMVYWNLGLGLGSPMTEAFRLLLFFVTWLLFVVQAMRQITTIVQNHAQKATWRSDFVTH